ncbi:hypothetical protein RFI_21634 [Reticulomyxa filosa]|uniref:Uncharacterized protein n=1 Tax=Reticulomyxa filosa TaxID=46433 RepID=X6MRK0_RETFI|nr:hypothetical protein RFI_21634 [Reticulomyxa filosa]|eukprot:ETO15730.1 hypothetical protein RFI_21634 [Reticulomyxa filosa]
MLFCKNVATGLIQKRNDDNWIIVFKRKWKRQKLGKQSWEPINLQGYYTAETCLVSKAKLTVWMNGKKYVSIILIVNLIVEQCSYTIKSGLTYELKANKIRQHAKNIEDLIERANMNEYERDVKIQNHSCETNKFKRSETSLEKDSSRLWGDFNQTFDIVAIIWKKAEQFNLIVSENKDFFDKQLQ